MAEKPAQDGKLPAVRTRLTSEIPLISRDAEMDWILAKLKGPNPAAFVLAGAAGVGKTRLASEAARSAAGLGFATAQAVASRAAAAIPFGPFAPFLPVSGHSPGDLLGLLQQASDAIVGRQARTASFCWSSTTPSSSTKVRPPWSTSWCRRGPAAWWPACVRPARPRIR